MQILSYLLETVFFFLTGAALLRGWMNTRRLRMTQQPGIFLMAVTDWIVQPMRRVLPRSWAQANIDWGSFLSGAVLALLYAVLWALLLKAFALPSAIHLWGLEVPLMALTFLIRTVLQGWMLLAFAYVVFSWVQPGSPVYHTLDRLLEPLLRPIRSVIPPIGGVDLSVLLFLVLLQVLLMLL